ncbi:MAG: DUF814 domain-containing protein [Synergistales bacterium]|nr:DUF814 domain-containing protein [Synergistales bacterium]
MNFGPEMFEAWYRNWNDNFCGDSFTKIIGGKNWAALHLANARKWLFFSWDPVNPGCSISDPSLVDIITRIDRSDNPFVSLLKKYLLKAKAFKADHIDRDRILVLECQKRLAAGFTRDLRLLFEISGPRSNLILIDSEGLILDSAVRFLPGSNQYRTIFPGAQYFPPPPFTGISTVEFAGDPSLDRLKRVKGIGRGLISEIEWNWEDHDPFQWAYLIERIYTPQDQQDMHSFIQLTRDRKNIIAFPEMLSSCSLIGREPLISLDRLVPEGLVRQANRKYEMALSDMFRREKKSITRHLDGLADQYGKASSAEEFRTKGDLLLAYAHEIEQGAREAILNDFQDPHKKITIPLDPHISIVQNAQAFYKLYRKYRIDPEKIRQKMTYLESRIKDLEEEQSSLSLIEDPVCFYNVARDTLSDRCKSLPCQKNRKRPARFDYLPILKYEWGNCWILVGLNSRGNRHLTFREAHGGDLWFHVYEMPGAHVILQGNDTLLSHVNSEILLSLAASLAAYHSKARGSGKVRVIYTEKKNVRAIPGGDTAQVTYKNASSLLIDPFYWKSFLAEKE